MEDVVPRRSKGVRLYLEEREGREPQYVIIDRKRKRRTGFGPHEIEAANEALREYLAENYRPDTSKRSLAAITCQEVIDLYLTDIAPKKPSAATIGYNASNLLSYWADKTLAEVKGSTCRKYVEHRATKPRPAQPQTARRELKVLSAAINHWHRESPLVAVPAVTLPEAGPARERVLTRKEVARMLWAARKLKLPHVARFILIGVYTGTRHNAALTLRWQRSPHCGYIDVEAGVIFRRGQAERETTKRRPPIRIPWRIAGRVARWKQMDDGKVQAVIHYKGQPVAKMKRAWHSVVKEAGLGREVVPHVLRHTCASWLLHDGKTIWEVSKILGASPTMLERVYGHHMQDEPERKRA